MTINDENNNLGAEIKSQRKNNRIFGFFLILDFLILGLIIYEIVALATGI